jgi:hypothetical protein
MEEPRSPPRLVFDGDPAHELPFRDDTSSSAVHESEVLTPDINELLKNDSQPVSAASAAVWSVSSLFADSRFPVAERISHFNHIRKVCQDLAEDLEEAQSREPSLAVEVEKCQ